MIIQLANYFGVSVDYLLGNDSPTNNPPIPKVAEKYASLEPDFQAKAQEYIAMLKVLEASRSSKAEGTDNIAKHA